MITAHNDIIFQNIFVLNFKRLTSMKCIFYSRMLFSFILLFNWLYLLLFIIQSSILLYLSLMYMCNHKTIFKCNVNISPNIRYWFCTDKIVTYFIFIVKFYNTFFSISPAKLKICINIENVGLITTYTVLIYSKL